MQYAIYKLNFLGSVHFGNRALERSETAFHADTLFSALCQEAVKRGQDALDALVQAAKDGRLLLSDAFPYAGDQLYLPKPYVQIDSNEDDSDSRKKKQFKKLEFVEVDLYEKFLSGEYPIEEQAGHLDDFGKHEIRQIVSIRGLDDPMPYRVGAYRFRDDCGLYVIAGTKDNAEDTMLEDLFTALGFAGIGGKRSAGYGRFSLTKRAVPDILEKHLAGDYPQWVSLTAAIPKEEEMAKAVVGASGQMLKRSGFTASPSYSPTPMRKRDLYVYAAGSVFKNKFAGDVYDVADGGAHPVYRYAKPLFLGVKA